MTTGSSPFLTRLLAVVLAAGCVEEKPGVEGTTSLAVTVETAFGFGSEETRLPDDARAITISVSALDELGELDAAFDAPVDVYTHFLGTLTPERGGGLAPVTVALVGGRAEGIPYTIPATFGETFLWVEDAVRAAGAGTPTYATGTSARLWYRDPFLVDVSKPVDDTLSNSLERSPLEGKQVQITASRYGAAGRLVITGVYSQGYTVSDVDCAATPCVSGAYDHVYIFTFGRPRAEDGTAIEVGHLVSWVAGGIGEFNGFTEFNFPQTLLLDPDEMTEDVETDPSRLPEPAVLDPIWLTSPTGADGMINLERVESALVAVENGTVCPLDDEYTTYSQWKLDVGWGCSKPFNIITKGAVTGFEPSDYVGQVMPRVVGTLRAVNIGTFHVWIIYPRQLSDLTTM